MLFAALQISTNLSVQVCSYPVNLGTWENPGPEHRILWRCSIVQEAWRCPSVDSIDFSTMILGFATNFLPDNFYNTYAA